MFQVIFPPYFYDKKAKMFQVIFSPYFYDKKCCRLESENVENLWINYNPLVLRVKSPTHVCSNWDGFLKKPERIVSLVISSVKWTDLAQGASKLLISISMYTLKQQ